ncbi:hypothetical protein M1555_00010 [Patescibacteria group bacterium]|nr:hypothetical protein [Patescibacteria group bacterium]
MTTQAQTGGGFYAMNGHRDLNNLGYFFAFAAAILFLAMFVLLALVGSGNQAAATFMNEMLANATAFFNAVKSTGSQLYSGRVAPGIPLEQIIIVTLVGLIAFVHPLFNVNSFGLRATIGAGFILFGARFPAPWNVVALILGPLFMIEIRDTDETWWLQVALISLVIAIASLIAYAPVFFFPALKEGFSRVGTIMNQIVTVGFWFMILVFVTIALVRGLDGTKTYCTLAILLFEWVALGHNPWTQWGAPSVITQPEQLLGGGFGDQFFATVMFVALIIVFFLLLGIELFEVSWLEVAQMGAAIFMMALAWVTHTLVVPANVGWLSAILALPTFVLYLVYWGVLSTFIPRPQLGTYEQTSAGFVRLRGRWQGQIVSFPRGTPALGKMWWSYDLILPYLLIPLVLSLI